MAKRAAKGPILVCLQLLLCFSQTNCIRAKGKDGSDDKIKGMFVFGSSLVDNGNNNYLENSTAKADFLPYGIDFPKGPSGRFTNGKNVIDLLGEMLKLPCLIPPFSDPSTKGSKVVHGVNFASGASGILDDTGFLAGQVISLNQQIRNFETVTLPQMQKQLRVKRRETRKAMKKYMFIVGTGGNDYLFNYFARKGEYNASLETFTANLTTSLSLQLRRLYRLGARKFVLISVYPLGCSPMLNAMRKNGCIEVMNEAAVLFNNELKSIIDRAKSDMPTSNIVLVNSYNIVTDIIQNLYSRGFKDANNPCCEVVPLRQLAGNGISCKKGGRICKDRSAHVFFDGLHPTEKVNVEIATKAFTSKRKTEVYPINVNQLAQL
ncbi:GDSL esterase/lipase [Gossypium australe]|uniref:GDSL esterase/lipase n=1 Tax=Gossypium australe TaxID=47621 RepID=A0A5B6U8D5_9ROSI|nr:GDSL esterase/lipase [Gossypium australe]